MAKLELTPVTSLGNPSILAAINANSDAIEEALENTLSRDGTLPNQMEADFDMNSNDILNVGTIHTDTVILNGEQLLPSAVAAQTFLQAGSGATARTMQDKARESISVKDFGAVGDGVTDDTEAFRKALAAIIKYSYTDTFGSFPTTNEAGGAVVLQLDGSSYRITGNLTDLSAYGVPAGRMQGVIIRGAGMYKTRIFVDCGNNGYLFDNYGDGSSPYKSYIGLSFQDMAFDGGDTPSSASSFMRMWSDGQADKFHMFQRVLFRNLRTVVRTEGSANTDVLSFDTCRFTGIWNHVLYLNNPESLCHMFKSCEVLACFCDSIFYSANGGCVYWDGGSLINGYAAADGGKDTPQYVFDLEGPTHGNNRFVIKNVRVEVPSIYSLLVKATNANAAVRVTFEDVTFAGVVSPSTPREVVTLSGRQLVEFVRCQMPTGGSTDAFKYRMASTTNDQGATIRPTILFDCCEIPVFNKNHYAFTNATDDGKVIATNCYNQRIDTVVPGDATIAMDFSWPAGGGGSGIRDFGPKVHRVALMRQGTNWPRNSASAFNEKHVLLPNGATILRIVVYKPTGQATVDANTYQLHVGSNDKVTTYGSSTSGRYDAEHKIVLNDLLLRVGDDANKREVRLWCSPTGGTGGHIEGFAIVEYI